MQKECKRLEKQNAILLDARLDTAPNRQTINIRVGIADVDFCLPVVGAKDAAALHNFCGLCAGAIVATLQPRQRVPLCAVCTSSSSARTSCASAPSTRGTPAHSNMVAILHIMCIRHLCRLDELETANEHYLKDVRVTRVKELELELRTYYDMARQCV